MASKQKTKNSEKEIRAYMRDVREAEELRAAAARTQRSLSGFVRYIFQEWKQREQSNDDAATSPRA